MSTLLGGTTPLSTAHPPARSVDMAAIAAHGIGRGDFAALVFSGRADLLGEVSGYGTWLSARKFVLPDPRLAAADDLARQPGWPHPAWPTDRIAPTPGVCFVFADDGHPAVDSLLARGGVEYEHFVVLTRLTLIGLMRRRLGRFLERVGSMPIAVLGYGDQGSRVTRELMEAGIAADRILILDDRADRQVAASNAGLRIVTMRDPVLASAAIISSPLTCPLPFAALLDDARRAGRPAMDNSLPWDDQPEWTTTHGISRTGCAARATTFNGRSLVAADHGLELPLRIAQFGDMNIAGRPVPALRSSVQASLLPESASPSIDLLRPLPSDQLGHVISRVGRAFVHLEGQSNHQDAAFAILVAREFLASHYPEAVADVLPAAHRGTLGSTPFERTVVRTTTGRSLGSPYMTPTEQAAIGVLARHFCGKGSSAAPIVEIGSAIGGSTLLMAAATEAREPSDGPAIFSIDPDVATRPAMRALFEHAGYAGRLTQVVATSDIAIRDLAHLTGRVGLVFIDGLHTRACSAADFRAYAPLVYPGGCIAFHDCDGRHAGVFRTVSELAASSTTFTLRCLIDTIAVFERNA